MLRSALRHTNISRRGHVARQSWQLRRRKYLLSTHHTVVDNKERLSRNDNVGNVLPSSSSSPTQRQHPPPPIELTLQRRVHVRVGNNNNRKQTNERFTVPLTVADVHLRHEQLPFAYFFAETLCPTQLEASLTAVLQQQFAVAGGRICAATYTAIECHNNDTIPLSFANVNATLAEWNTAVEEEEDGTGKKKHRGHVHRSGDGKHPILLPIFDALFSVAESSSNHKNDNREQNLVSVRVTYFACGATCLAVTANHCLADTASCVRLVQVWGQEMIRQQKRRQRQNMQLVLNRCRKDDDHDDTIVETASSSNLQAETSCCWNRSLATTAGMMTPATVELLGIATATPTAIMTAAASKESLTSSWMRRLAWSMPDSWWFNNNSTTLTNLDTKTRMAKNEPRTTPDSTTVDHEYVSLHFSASVLIAMKAHGMMMVARSSSSSSSDDAGEADASRYVSTNDLVTAVCWLCKRRLSRREAWNLAVVVNLRGRCGVGKFANRSQNNDILLDGISHKVKHQRSGLFGNAITMVVAKLPPTVPTTMPMVGLVEMEDVSRAAQSIRQALVQGIEEIPDRMALSRLGKAAGASTPSSMNTFSTTSWGQLSPWKIQFSDHGGSRKSLLAFHGQPAHPLPVGCTYSSVVHARLDNGEIMYELFLPSKKADEARHLHAQLCSSYLEWYTDR